MQSSRDRLSLLDRVVSEAVSLGIGHCQAQGDCCDGRIVRIDSRDLIHFGSCSYLGLEMDPRLIEGSVSAVRRFGTHSSSSRAYLSSPLYTELEALLEEIFEAHVVLAPTTTLGHLSALPSLVDEDDAIVMDHQVHASVQMACKLMKASGVHCEIMRHNRMDRLEKRVTKLAACHRQVWYMADGVYSMFGDFAPYAELEAMLARQPQMRFYVDDAHGTSWCGRYGSGSVPESLRRHPRVVMTTGLAKGFGSGGGVLIFPDEEQKRRVRNCGPSMIFGGPLQPAILGAGIASARIHLSDEIQDLQAGLRERLAHCAELFEHHRLPVVSTSDTPVGFLGMGAVKAAQTISARMMEEGFFINSAQFPATPMRRSGARFLLSLHHTLDDIEGLVEAFARHWEPCVRAAGATPESVWEAFGLERPEARLPISRSRTSSLHLEVANSIDKLGPSEWDELVGHRGCMAREALVLFESVFASEADPMNHWDFRYYIVRDESGRPVLATYFTRSLWKADMLSSPEISERAEARRSEEPGYLTQNVFGMGCLLSEGDHLWLREPATSELSRRAIEILLAAVRIQAHVLDCEIRVLRDLPAADPELIAQFERDGFLPMASPESLVVDDVMESEEQFVASLSQTHRYHQRRRVAPWNDFYVEDRIGVEGRSLAPGELDHLHSLYRNVKARSLVLNTFDLPKEILSRMAQSPGWEIVCLRPRDAKDDRAVGFFASFVGPEAYVPIFAGLEYAFVEGQGLYRQVLRHALGRARALGRPRVMFGMGATLEKRRFGARPEAATILIEADDHFAFDALADLGTNAG